MICLQTPSFGWSFQDGRQLVLKPVHHNNELLDPVLCLRSVLAVLCRIGVSKPGEFSLKVTPDIHVITTVL